MVALFLTPGCTRMVFFKKFFTAKTPKAQWYELDADGRRQALTGFSNDAQRLEFIGRESSAELRLLAVGLLTESASLNSLLSSSDDKVRHEARRLLLQQIMPGGDLSTIQDTATLLRIAGLTDDNELRIAAISRITDENERLAIATSHAVARVRSAAAEGIHSHALLQQLADYAQSKDKTLYRIAKDKLAHFKAEAAQQEAQAEAVNNLLAQLRYLNKVGYHPEFNGKLQVARQQLQALAPAGDIAAAINTELTQAEATLTSYAAEENRQQQAAAEAAKVAAAQDDLITELTTLAGNAHTLAAAELHALLVNAERRWDALFHSARPDAAKARSFENTLQQLFALHSALQQQSAVQEQAEKLLAAPVETSAGAMKKQISAISRCLNDLRWPESVEQPDWLSALIERQSALNAALAQFDEQAQQRNQAVSRDLTTLQQAVKDGQLKEASKLAQRIQSAISSSTDMALVREFRALSGQLHDMRDWAGFATTPKKEALLASMEALVGADIAADLLAEKIHALQDEWKTLGNAATDHDLWQRFKAAGDKAYEPCRAYFEELGQLREKNKVLREQLINDLTTYEQAMDWGSADWKMVQRTLDTARETFRGYSPVDRIAHKDSQDRFSAVCDRIYAHIKGEYDRNLAIKQSIADEAQALAGAEDLSNAAAQVKELQARWKQVGITPRGPDQKLWQQFRGHCDAVFARLNESRNARRAEIDEAVNRAEAIVTQAQQSAASGDEDTLNALSAEFTALSLPKSAHQRLSQALKDAAAALRQQRQQARSAQESSRWDNVIARLQGNVDASSELPEGFSGSEFDGGSDDARDLCILMEILADSVSPDTDRNRRMELQVQRLAEGLGKGLSKDQERIQLISRWPANAEAALLQRFITALRASL